MIMRLIGTLSLPVAIMVGFGALVLLVLSANLAVEKMVALAEYLQLSATFMGMTVVSLATSIPEITAHLTASASILAGSLDYRVGSAIVLGSNIGSDVVQQTLILGLVVLVTGSLYFRRYFLWKSLLPMIGSAVLCLILGLDGTFSRLDGAVLFATFVGYIYYLYVDERKHFGSGDEDTTESDTAPAITTGRQALLATAITLGAMLLTVFAAQAVLGVTEKVVMVTGIGGSLIGVVTLGVASALPELTTALAGARKKEHGISLGTLVGSNITNPLVGIGLGALVSTYAAPRPLLAWDLPWQAVSGAVLLGYLLLNKGRIGRGGAIFLIAMYAVYLTFRALFFAVD
jgi:cation:H+ antiporter